MQCKGLRNREFTLIVRYLISESRCRIDTIRDGIEIGLINTVTSISIYFYTYHCKSGVTVFVCVGKYCWYYCTDFCRITVDRTHCQYRRSVIDIGCISKEVDTASDISGNDVVLEQGLCNFYTLIRCIIVSCYINSQSLRTRKSSCRIFNLIR